MTEQFTKTVAFKAVNEEERTATGAVLVPNEVDRQRDFLRPAGVEAMFAEDPDDGVMHAAFPDGAADLVRSEIVDEPVELNGERYPAGTWVATRKYEDDDLWQLVKDGVLTGFSIGGRVEEIREYDAADVPDDVSFPDGVPVGGATEIVDGRVEEVSDVDIPAVPRATYRELSKLGKSITEEVDGEAEFVDVMRERGHSESDARELWAYLQANKAAKAETEKPIILPNGAQFDDFDECVREVSGDGTTVAEAERVCGAGREQNKVNINGTEVDLTPPASMVNAAEAALDAKERLAADIGDCGSGRGEQRAEQIVSGDLAPADFVSRDNGTPIPAYLSSHAEDAPDTDATPPNWSDETWTDGCGPVQLALWGGTGGGEPREWAMRRANEIAIARDEDAPYQEVGNMDTDTKTEKQEYSTGDWVVWPRLGGDSRGRVVEIIEEPGEGFSDAISGDVSVEAEEDNPVYLLEVWDGVGDEASAREDEAGRGDTMHVANREDRLREVDDPRDLEAGASKTDERAESRAGQTKTHMNEDINDVDDATLGARIKSALGFGSGDADDGGNSSEDADAGTDAEKAGRTLSQSNRRAVMAAIDAQLDLLNDAGVDHGMERFTDRADFAFDLSEYGDKGSAPASASDEMDKDAPAGETADEHMTEDDTNPDSDAQKASDAPAWAESLVDKVESIEKRVDEMDEDADAAKSLDEAPDWAADLAEKVDGLDERVDKVSKATADTQQAGGAEQTGDGELSEKEKAKRSIFLPNGGN